MQRILALMFLVSLLPAYSISAQSQKDGSIYSRFGLGERQQFLTSRSQAMGGGGYALAGTRYTNFANPAALSDQVLTRFAGGFSFESIKVSAEGFDQGTVASGTLSAVQIGFPLVTNKTGLGFSFSPYTRVSYRVDSPASIIADPENGGDTPLISRFGGSGGIQKLSMASGHRISRNVSLGLSLDYLFGIIEESQGSSFNSTLFVDRTVEKTLRLRGLTATAGARYVVPGLPTGKALVFGATISLPTTLSGKRALALTTAVGSDTLSTTSSGDVKLPLALALGVAYQPEARWTLIADASYEGWSSFESDFDLPGYSAASNSSFDNRLRLSAGAEFWPAGGRPFANYGTRIAYRLGVYSDQSYVSPDEDEPIRSLGITGGLSIPSLIPGTNIDLNIDIGHRGTTSNGLVRDRYIRFNLNINFGDRWFDRRPLG